jgi:hypothetical protein
MSSPWIALAVLALLASQEANAACVLHGARPTVPLPTMASGQEFSFIASPDCETLRFTIRGTDLTKNPTGAGDVDGEGHDDLLIGTPYEGSSRTGAAYLVLGPVTGTLDLSRADAKFLGEAADDHVGFQGTMSGAGDVDGDGHGDLLFGAAANGDGGAAFLIYGGGL